MSSEVEICNLALSHLGDTATVASINPPEGSAQAEHCARYYPIARDTLLEMHTWSFATRRATLALLTETMEQWLYIYAMPSLVVSVISVLPPLVTDDYSIPSSVSSSQTGYNPEIIPAAGLYSPQPFSIETLSTGDQVICTNQESALLRYTTVITDPTKFSPLFTMALSHLLASMLAGPIIKGEAGRAEAKAQYAIMQRFLVEAAQSDAGDRNIKPAHIVPWMAGR